MPVLTDFVLRGCIVNTNGCSLTNKCEECKKELQDLVEIDAMFKRIQSQYIERELPEQNKETLNSNEAS